jgi:hypothetical protein
VGFEHALFGVIVATWAARRWLSGEKPTLAILKLAAAQIAPEAARLVE